ncbi:hypothetical protein C1645_836377 [Glomus cerebriforme]|uniref:Ion transport domain-containing protein n=1 Tax=Glomus cerebriforme TaxID=658196 RepID=A0A397SCP9_9GLOM|nr:hypothetical protein C1645_836377 [Glomus cerebriforme]
MEKVWEGICYFAIWSIFIVLLICFTIASYPTNSISQEARIKLHQTSIAFGIEYFGVYFAIIFGVSKHIFSFLVVLAMIIATPNPNDSNNPWTLSNTYQVYENGTVLNETFIQEIKVHYHLGDQTPSTENTTLFILMVTFSFLIVIYLMNLFIGLLSSIIEVIEKDNNRASYLALKAEVIAEIEIFCLLPHQRRWRSWFPEVKYYAAGIEEN